MNYQMQAVLNEPTICNFLATVDPQEHPSTLQELILIGINVVSSKIHANSQNKENHHVNHPSASQEWDLLKELQTMKFRIDELTQLVMRRSRKHETISANKTITFQDANQEFKNIQVNQCKTTDLKKEDIKITPKVTQTLPQGESANPSNSRGRSRHHLDDSEVKKALTNPYAKQEPIRNKSKKLEKKFEYQEEINKEQLKMIKSIHCEEEPINRSRRSKTTNQQFKAQSKIKNLIAQDKFKFKKTRAPEYDFNKYEYSDDESEYLEQEPSKVEESEPQYEYSSFQQPNIPRQEVDVVSNSSSFSKFSLGSQREAGKISSRKKKE